MTFDIIIRNGSIIDGTATRAPFLADIGIVGDRIAAVDGLGTARASLEIDASDRVVCPGFIDVHVHSELALIAGDDRYAGICQGVTTQLTAPDGFGWVGLSPECTRQMWDYTRFAVGEVELELGWPAIEDYLAIFSGSSASNLYPQIPHCALRLAVMGWDPSPASDTQIAAMADAVREWMEAGAAGLCLGLDYQPSANADTRELVALCKVVASYGGLYAAHQRYHTLGREAAWEETLELSRLAGIPVHVSHERIDNQILGIFERVEREDIDLTFEAYLYSAGMSHLTIMLPVEVQIGTPDEVIENLKKPEVREKSLPHLREWLGACNQIMGYTRSGRYTGRTLSDLAGEAGVPPEAFAYDLVVEEEGVCTYIFPWQVSLEEADESVARTAVHPRLMIASDGVFNVPHPHPRGFGCFVQVLGRFVREKGLLSLAQGVHKMSGFPARRFGLSDRGEIAQGKAADLVVFDPETVGAGATFEEPRKPPVGIDQVFVNGVLAVEHGVPTGRMSGRVLKRGS